MLKKFRSYQLAVQFYQSSLQVKLPYYLKNQLLRAASSVALNLSEATGKNTNRDRRRFFSIAMGSIRECQSVTELEPNAFTTKDKDLLDHLAASTYKLIKNSNPYLTRRPESGCRWPDPPKRF